MKSPDSIRAMQLRSLRSHLISVLRASAVSMAATAWAQAAPTAITSASAAPSLRFEQVFSEAGEPPALHFRARYVSRGSAHRLDVWRDRDQRLVRRTDDLIETHVNNVAGGPSYQMVVLDLRRKIETRVVRDDMYRIGNFTEWFDLAHGLRHPQANYRLTRASAPDDGPTPIGRCRWYLLEQGTSHTRICWSATEHLPLVLMDERGTVLWRITEVNRIAPPASVFLVHDKGFVRVDASQDISGD